MLSLFDIVISAIIFGSSFLGLQKGMLKIILGIILFILTITSTILLFPYAQKVGNEYTTNNILTNIISCAFCYIFSICVITLISRHVKKLINKIAGTTIDRFSGLLLGLGRGWVISLIIFIFISIITTTNYMNSKNLYELFIVKNERYPQWLKKSISFNFFYKSFQTSINLFLKDILSNIQLTNWYRPYSNSLKTPFVVKQNKEEEKVDNLEKELNALIKNSH